MPSLQEALRGLVAGSSLSSLSSPPQTVARSLAHTTPTELVEQANE